MTTNSFYNHGVYPVYGSQSSSILDGQEWDKIGNAFTAVETALTAAASYSGAPAFATGTVYAAGFVVYSPVDGNLYRRITAGTGTTDPTIDTANWSRVVIGMPRVEVSGLTQTAVSGNNYWLENPAATAVTAPAFVDGAQFTVTPANGLLTNTIDFGATIVRGPAGTVTGILTMNLGAPMTFWASSAISRWVLVA